MKNHCVSLEIGKLLDKAGWKKPTQFYYTCHHGANDEYHLQQLDNSRESKGLWEVIPAPLATEILEELPYGYHVWKSVCMENDLGDWVCVHFSEPEFEYGEHWEQANNPCDALAKMWLYLREKKEV